MKNRGGDQRGGGEGEREPNKIVSQEPSICSMFKTSSKKT
jgi:hypothetical protein